jgi:hypothetical protein
MPQSGPVYRSGPPRPTSLSVYLGGKIPKHPPANPNLTLNQRAARAAIALEGAMSQLDRCALHEWAACSGMLPHLDITKTAGTAGGGHHRRLPRSPLQ